MLEGIARVGGWSATLFIGDLVVELGGRRRGLGQLERPTVRAEVVEIPPMCHGRTTMGMAGASGRTCRRFGPM